jgi:hypothetical protein
LPFVSKNRPLINLQVGNEVNAFSPNLEDAIPLRADQCRRLRALALQGLHVTAARAGPFGAPQFQVRGGDHHLEASVKLEEPFAPVKR